MSLIPCDEKCVYQTEGYCRLETPAVIANFSGLGCAYMIPKTDKKRKELNLKQEKPKEDSTTLTQKIT